MERPLDAGTGSLKIDGKELPADYIISRAENGAHNVEVTLPAGEEVSPAARLFTHVTAALSHFLKSKAASVAAASIAVGVLADYSKGTVLTNISEDPASQALAKQFSDNLLSVNATFNGINFWAGSAIRLDDNDAILCAHELVGTLGTATVTSVTTMGGTTVPVSGQVIYPGYDASQLGSFDIPDLAVIHFATRLSGQNLTLGTASVGDVITGGGFGVLGTPATGYLPHDGIARAWEAPVTTSLPFNASSLYYFDTRFDPNLTGLALNGKGSPGDSGGIEVNAFGDLIGMSTYEAGGTSGIGDTGILNLRQPQVFSFVSSNSAETPEPGTFAILVVAGGCFILWRPRQGSAPVADDQD